MKKTRQRKRNPIPIPHLCRICLTGGLSMVSLQDSLDPEHNINISKVLEKVMNCWIVSSEKTPKHICMMCLSLLRIAYNLRLQFEQSQKKLSIDLVTKTDNLTESSKINHKQKKSEEVELLIGDANYSLKDLLIVEEDEEPQDFSYFLSKLGKDITAEFVNKNETSHDKLISEQSHLLIEDIDSKNNFSDDLKENDEYETIFIQTISDDESLPTLPIGHEYAKCPKYENCYNSGIPRLGSRKKLPKNMLDKINSLIIEGDGNIQNTKDKRNKDPEETFNKLKERLSSEKKRKRRSCFELQDIDKYIICGTDDGLPIEKNNVMENFKEIPKNQDEPKTKIDKSLLNDDMILDALNSKHVCRHCSKVCATGFGLRRHLIQEHREDNKKRKLINNNKSTDIILKRKIQNAKRKLKSMVLLCKVCGHISKSAGGARYHSLTHGDRKFSCDHCPQKFFTPSHLKKHVEFKHKKIGTNQHLCPLCGIAKNSYTALSYHLKVHTQVERKFVCNICGVKFLVKSALNNHLRRHKGERRFACDMCDKAFYTSNELKNHTTIHTGERPLKCNYCEKRFVTKFNRSLHMMTHEGPYVCQYCGKNFIDLEMITFHMKYKHRLVVKDVLESSTNDNDDFDDEEQKYASYQLSIQAPTSTSDELDEFDLLRKAEMLDFEGD